MKVSRGPGQHGRAPWRVPGSVRSEGAERGDGVRVLDARQRLDALGDEAADVLGLVQVELGQQIVAARGGVDLRGLIDLVGDQRRGLVRLPQITLDHDEDGVHGRAPYHATSESGLGLPAPSRRKSRRMDVFPTTMSTIFRARVHTLSWM